MPRYKVTASMITDLYIEVEADSEEEALQIAEDADGADFIEEGCGDWEMGSANLIVENEKEVK